ncbi:MAG: hypothetical protein HC905_04700 [Bacteroidales bacterium]|nr:hypothetical protein [Bacteroidales bacterium]
MKKILERKEELHKEWPIQGSSGYDFLALVNNLFTYNPGITTLENFYKTLDISEPDPQELIYKSKKKILLESFRADWNNLFRMLENSGLVEFNSSLSPNNMKEALGEFLVNCPVYKLYSSSIPLDPEDKVIVKEILERSAKRNPQLTPSLRVLENIFLNPSSDEEKNKLTASVFQRCMQYTGPLTAKGIEDTAMYAWCSFLAHNEVGDAIDARGITIPDFHKKMIEKTKIPSPFYQRNSNS